MTGKKTTHVSEEKKKTLTDLEKLLKENETVLVASIKNIPASQFQEISKKLRGKAVVKVPKKSLTFRALDSLGNEDVEKLKDKVEDSVAILFSNMDAYELAAYLLDNRSPAKAKAGQEAPEDIEVEAGPTDLVPGPAISELGALGIQIQIEKGKIHIKEPKVIAKAGQKISQGAADLMGKLDIKPFTVGFTPVAAFDKKTGKVYLDMKIDKEGTLNELKTAFGKSLAFAVEIGYAAEDTISFIIGKAGIQSQALEKFVGEKSGAVAEEVKEENKELSDDKVEQKEPELTETTKSENSEPTGEGKSKDKPEEENSQEVNSEENKNE